MNYKKETWKLFSLYIRLKYADDNGYVQCCTCGVKKHYKEMQAGHFIAGRNNSILFEEKCVHPQCGRCNVYKHGNTVEYFYFMERKYGKEEIDKLYYKSKMTVQFRDCDYKLMILDFKKKLSKLKYKQV